MTEPSDEEDAAWAKDIRERCSTRFEQFNGEELDRIMCEFMDRHNMPAMRAAFEAVECWRA